jgi:hypothetical protein
MVGRNRSEAQSESVWLRLIGGVGQHVSGTRYDTEPRDNYALELLSHRQRQKLHTTQDEKNDYPRLSSTPVLLSSREAQ